MPDEPAGVVRAAPPATATTGTSILPIISICLLAIGGVLLVQQLWLHVDWLVGSAVALVLAATWAVALYVGTFITLLYLPALAVIAVVLLVIAGRQAWAGQGVGWHLWLGGALLALFILTVLSPAEGRVVAPIVLIALGAALAAGTAPAPEIDPERRAERGY